MEYRVLGECVALRLEADEEVCASILKVCEKEQITLATVEGLGAARRAVIGVYNLQKREFLPNQLQGNLEITSLVGSVTQKDGEPYLHLHASFGDEAGTVRGGHLSRAWISATAEIFLHRFDGRIERRLDKATGLQVFAFR